MKFVVPTVTHPLVDSNLDFGACAPCVDTGEDGDSGVNATPSPTSNSQEERALRSTSERGPFSRLLVEGGQQVWVIQWTVVLECTHVSP